MHLKRADVVPLDRRHRFNRVDPLGCALFFIFTRFFFIPSHSNFACLHDLSASIFVSPVFVVILYLSFLKNIFQLPLSHRIEVGRMSTGGASRKGRTRTWRWCSVWWPAHHRHSIKVSSVSVCSHRCSPRLNRLVYSLALETL